MLDRTAASTCVARGAKYLDEFCPFWHIAVNRDFDVSRDHGCLIGQLYNRGFHAYLAKTRNGLGWALDHGFYTEDPDDYDTLHGLWQAEIDSRLDPRYGTEGRPVRRPRFRSTAFFRPFRKGC